MKKMTEERLAAERQRLFEMQAYERQYRDEGYAYVLGVDEAGRGPLCGPVAAACCILPLNCEILYLNDSKKLTEARREALFSEIEEKATAYGIGLSDAARIDEINILNATFEAMRDAIRACEKQLAAREGEAALHAPRLILVDGNREIRGLMEPQKTLVKGDAHSLSIAAASVLAKVTRDRILRTYDEQYPQYGFAKHKGYGTKQHIEAIKAYGLLPIHRKSFLKNILSETAEKEQ